MLMNGNSCKGDPKDLPWLFQNFSLHNGVSELLGLVADLSGLRPC